MRRGFALLGAVERKGGGGRCRDPHAASRGEAGVAGSGRAVDWDSVEWNVSSSWMSLLGPLGLGLLPWQCGDATRLSLSVTYGA